MARTIPNLSFYHVTTNELSRNFYHSLSRSSLRYHRLYQCEPESGTIRQLTDYEIPSSRHSLAHITSDHRSFLFLVYQYPTVCLDLWRISANRQNCSVVKRWSSKELFPRADSHDDDDDDEDEDEETSSVCGISSMRYANGTLHFLARHERHWSLHLFAFSVNKENVPLLTPQRRIDIDSTHLRCSGENFQMEILPADQGWLFAIRRPYLIHLDSNGKTGKHLVVFVFVFVSIVALFTHSNFSSSNHLVVDETLC